MQVKNVPIELLNFDPSNVRKHDAKNIAAIKASIAKFKQVEPLIVQKSTNVVIGGNGRLEAMKALGYTHADVNYLDIDNTQAGALAIALNRTAELAEWDKEGLGSHLQGLREDGWELEELGFEIDDLEELTDQPDGGPVEGEDDVPEIPQNIHNVQRGQIWQLGNHRLMCGDSTAKEDVDRLMAGEKADMVFTDPPYGVSIEGKFTGSIENDNLRGSDLEGFLSLNHEVMSIMSSGSRYICYEVLNSPEFFSAYGRPDEVICWNKDSASFYSDNKFNRKFELILFYANGTKPKIKAGTNVWEFPKSSSFNSRDENGKRFNERGNYCVAHPTTKPVGLSLTAIECSSTDSVADPFLGSGSTLIACEKTNRKCYGMEISEHYCSVIIERWQNFTDKKAVLV